MELDLSKYIGYSCILNSGNKARIEKSPYEESPTYAYRVMIDERNWWSVTKEGYVYTDKQYHRNNVKSIITLGGTELIPSKFDIKPTKKSKPVTKKKFFAYFNHDMEELQRTETLPTGTLITIISIDCSEKEFERYDIVLDAVTK